MFRKYNILLVVHVIVLMLAGCKQAPMLPGIGPHKIDIQQGNAVTQDMVAKLQPGMSRSQVRFALGTPLLVDPFRADRWDYYYSYTKGGELVEQRRLVVFFKDDKLDRVEGDVIPAKPVADTAAAGKPKPVAAPVKPDAAKPAEGGPEVAKAPSATPAPVEVPAAPVASGDGEPVAAKPVAKPEEKPQAERGFFGRMLDKIGF